MIKLILATSFVAITSSALLAAEPSAFGAGNLENPSPYGLTSSEKAVLQNKNSLKKVVVNSMNQANNVESLRERIDGLQSIIESLSRKSQKNKRDISQLLNKNDEDLKSADEYEKRLGEVVEQNSKEIEELKKTLKVINSQYITRKEFNKLVNSVNQFKDLMFKELKTDVKTGKNSSLSSMSSSDVANKAKAFYNKKYYTKGIEYYSHLILKNYKPANAHFMIAQMKFKRKNYAEAISFYKKSAALYSKASYMPELMLNTAISMEKTGDKKNAKAFFNGVVAKYPDSTQAENAQKYLK